MIFVICKSHFFFIILNLFVINLKIINIMYKSIKLEEIMSRELIKKTYSFSYPYMVNGYVKEIKQSFPNINTTLSDKDYYDFAQSALTIVDTNSINALLDTLELIKP